MSKIERFLDGVALPPVAPVSQHFETSALENPEEILAQELEKHCAPITPGMRIAITCGSRGIDHYAGYVKTIVSFIKKMGGSPFLVPSMGSHGGATAEGQARILAEYGITEKSTGAPVISSMETVEIGQTAQGLPVRIDQNAYQADGIILLNRIKPHTSFRGKYESGLVKMLAIGLAKQKGAEMTHFLGYRHMAEAIEETARIGLERLNILCGCAVIENAAGHTAELYALEKEEILAKEPELLRHAWGYMPRILLDEIDVLLVGQAGKDISGTGMDTNIIGRFHTTAAFGGPDTVKLGLLDLTAKSEGNANGMGLSDFITRRFYKKIDFESTWLNTLTSTEPNSSRMPTVLENDEQVTKACAKLCGQLKTEHIRLAIIKSTKDLGEIWLSPAALSSVVCPAQVRQTGDFAPIPFDQAGNLSFWA